MLNIKKETQAALRSAIAKAVSTEGSSTLDDGERGAIAELGDLIGLPASNTIYIKHKAIPGSIVHVGDSGISEDMKAEGYWGEICSMISKEDDEHTYLFQDLNI